MKYLSSKKKQHTQTSLKIGFAQISLAAQKKSNLPKFGGRGGLQHPLPLSLHLRVF